MGQCLHLEGKLHWKIGFLECRIKRCQILLNVLKHVQAGQIVEDAQLEDTQLKDTQLEDTQLEDTQLEDTQVQPLCRQNQTNLLPQCEPLPPG